MTPRSNFCHYDIQSTSSVRKIGDESSLMIYLMMMSEMTVAVLMARLMVTGTVMIMLLMAVLY